MNDKQRFIELLQSFGIVDFKEESEEDGTSSITMESTGRQYDWEISKHKVIGYSGFYMCWRFGNDGAFINVCLME